MTQDQPSPGPAVTDLYNKHGSEIHGTPVAQLHAEDSIQELGSGMGYNIGNPERDLAELESYSPPLELSNGPSVKRASRDSRRSMEEDRPPNHLGL